MIRLMYYLLVLPAYYDARDWMEKQWRRAAPMATHEQDTCESCREVSCDCTKVKTCNQLHGLRPYQQAAIDDIKASPRHATYIPTGIGKGGMPVGRKVGRPTRMA
jgi:superfamily II DNA or RNA helicase